jgi:2-keto-3-deoxy-L-rhamnonate aldolase RhmA
VDLVLIGVGDLACGLGQPVPDGPVMNAARQRVLAATRSAEKRPGIFVCFDHLACTYAEEGFELIAVGNEMKLFMSGCQETMSDFRASRGL